MLEMGKTYYWKRSKSWKWFDGQDHWWEHFVQIDGFNGSCGYWLTEKSRWNGSEFMSHLNQIRSLTADQSLKLEQEIEANSATLERLGVK